MASSDDDSSLFPIVSRSCWVLFFGTSDNVAGADDASASFRWSAIALSTSSSSPESSGALLPASAWSAKATFSGLCIVRRVELFLLVVLWC